MALSTAFGKSMHVHYVERDSRSEEKISGCVLANVMRQSLSMYVELEKTHWHLRLNPAGRGAKSESADPTEIAREVCTISLRLIASISRLQRVLDPDLNPECAAMFAAVEEKITEISGLANERQFDAPEHLATLVF